MTDQLDHRDHWEILFDKQYLRWFHLQGKDALVTIEKVEKDVELTMRGGIKKKAGVVHFRGKDKPLVLNVTNAQQIASIHGPKPSQWPGKQIVLYPTTTEMYVKETKKKETLGCIRIRPAETKSSGK